MPQLIGNDPWRGGLLRSPYYWWWMYLKLNKQYDETCRNAGKGPCSDLYKDFGDVRPDGDDAFFAWWGLRGELHGRLFQERTLMPSAKLLKVRNDWTPVMGSYPYVVIAVDLHMGMRSAQDMIAQVLPMHFRKQVGRTPMRDRFSTARYKLSDYGTGRLFRDCYIAYLEMSETVARYGDISRIPSKDFIQLSNRVHRAITDAPKIRDQERQDDYDIRELYEQAEQWIEWVGKGSFPGPPLEEFKEWERIFDELVRTTGEPIQYMD
jgi:hypothetical protein